MQLNKIIEQEAERIIGTLQQDYHCEVLEIIQEEQKSCTGTNEAEIGASAIINLLVKKEVIKHVKSSFTHAAHFALTLPKQDNGDAWDELQGKFNAWLFENGEDTLDNFFSALKQHYSISKK